MKAPPMIPIKFIGQIASGGTPKPDAENWNGELPFITPPDLNGVDGAAVRQWERSLTPRGAAESTVVSDAVLLSCRAPIGHVGIADQSVAFNQGCKAIIPEDPEDLRYLAHALVAHRKGLQATGRGTTFTELSTTELASFSIPWPTSPQRASIADYLDREIAEIDAMTERLDRLRIKLSDLRRSRLVGLGKQLTERNDGGSTKIGLLLTKKSRPIRVDDGVVTAFRDGQVALRSRRREDGFTMSFSEHGYQGVEPGDFVFHGLDGFAGAVGVAEDRGKVSPVYHVCTATPLASECFMAWALRALSANGFLEAYASSVRQRSIDFRNWTTFAGLPMNYVPIDEQLRITDQLDDVTTHVDAMLSKVADLKALLLERRSALITDVVTGRKEVT